MCGLLELASVETDAARAERVDGGRAHSILASLIENYTPAQPEDSDALLLHGVYDLPKDNGVDEGTLWGDYFFLEALDARRAPRLEAVLVRLVTVPHGAEVAPGRSCRRASDGDRPRRSISAPAIAARLAER